jgi:hypothetical protein
MPSSRSLFAPAARGGLPGLLLAVPFLLGADDNYLREIEEEAKRQAVILITSPEQSTPTAMADPTSVKTDQLEAGLDPAAFEQALRKNLPGTYTVYQQLDANRKQQAYQAYQNDNQLTSISERIAQLLSGKP